MDRARRDEGAIRAREALQKNQGWNEISTTVLQLFRDKPLTVDVEMMQEMVRRVMETASGEDIYNHLSVRFALAQQRSQPLGCH